MALSTIIDTSLLRDRSKKSSRERTLRPGLRGARPDLVALVVSLARTGVKPSQ